MKKFFGSLQYIGDALAGRRLLVILDFDGTITALRREPSVVRLSKRMRRVLRKLAAGRRVRVVVLSGRSKKFLEERVKIKGVELVGEHGASLMPAGADRKGIAAVRRARPIIERIARKYPGAWVELKRHGVTLHYRRVGASKGARLAREAREALDHVRGRKELKLMSGKMVLETVSKRAWDKGDAAGALLKRHGRDRVPVFFGDDITDEDAFRVIGRKGVGVLVARRKRRSAARYRVGGLEEVARALDWIAEGA